MNSTKHPLQLLTTILSHGDLGYDAPSLLGNDNSIILVPELVNLEHAEDCDGVHERSVELEVGVIRTDVVTTCKYRSN